MSIGYVKLYRALAQSDLWLAEPFTKGQAWADLILNANFRDRVAYICGQQIPVKRGQIAWSEVTLAKRWRWSRGKVRRFLDLLKSDGKIVQETVQHTSIITICNYKKFQTDGTAHGTAGETENGTPDGTPELPKNQKNPEKTEQEAEHQNKAVTTGKVIEKQNVNTIDGTASDTSGGTPDSTTDGTQEKKGNKGKKEKNNYTVEFEQFWQAYPRKEKKSEALKVFEKISPGHDLLERIISDVQARSRTHDWTKENGKFVPHPTTYLNQKRWEDETPRLRGIDGGKKQDGAVRDDNGQIKGWWMFDGTEFVPNPEYRRQA